MLYMTSANRMTRIHAPYVSEDEIEKINDFLRSQAEPDYVDEILKFSDEKENSVNTNDNENLDELYNRALEIVKSERQSFNIFFTKKITNRLQQSSKNCRSNGSKWRSLVQQIM